MAPQADGPERGARAEGLGFLPPAVHALLDQLGNQSRPDRIEWPDIAPDTPLDVLGDTFELTAFERRVLLLAAAAEEEPVVFRQWCARELGSGEDAHLSPLLLRRWCPDADLGALESSAPLFRCGLLRAEGTGERAGRNLRPLSLTPGAHRFLLGGRAPELGPLEALPSSDLLTGRRRAQVGDLAGALSRFPDVLGNLYGDVRGAVEVAAAAFSRVGRRPVLLRMEPGLSDPARFVADVVRESALHGLGLVVQLAEGDADALLNGLLSALRCPAVVVGHDPADLNVGRAVFALEVGRPTPDEQLDLWARALNLSLDELAAVRRPLGRLAGQFDLPPEKMRRVGQDARAAVAREAGRGRGAGEPVALLNEAWAACRRLGRAAMRGARPLAELLEGAPRWDDLILPETDLEVLRDIALHARERGAVRRLLGAGAWRDGALVALFSGPSGTGKTFAAEVLAGELQLDLYRVDLSQLSSKWIGETEKNLAKLFDAADEGGVILLFDEADSVFGKRGDGADANGRHTNMQTNYLLQRLEAYQGLAILTTNLPGSLDPAFARRIRFELGFQEPGAAERLRLWQSAFPASVSTAGLDFGQLAQLKLSGASIKRAALHALYLSAARETPLDQATVERAAQRELRRLGRLTLSP